MGYSIRRHLRLVRGLSYSGAVHATKECPDVIVQDEGKYRAAMASGYFEEVPISEDMDGASGRHGGEGLKGGVEAAADESLSARRGAEDYLEGMGMQAEGGVGQQDPGQEDSRQDGRGDGGKASLNSMTLEELKAYALVGGIDISGLRKRGDILAAVKAAEEKAAEAREALRME